MRQQIVVQHPEAAQALAELGGKISDQEMQQLNYALDGQHRDVKDVAHEFLRRKGLVN
jgi:glycine betaine/choline ABC-type transport system substrate-binding protein